MSKTENHSFRLICTLLFSFASVLLTPKICFSEENEASKDGSEKSSCDFDASKALLIPDAYKNYVFKKAKMTKL